MTPSATPWSVLSSSVSLGQLTPGWSISQAPDELAPDEYRTFRWWVGFAAPFSSAPVVQLGITGFDVDQRDSPRLTVKAENITGSGFEAVLCTWAGTRVYSVDLSWLAIGA